MQISARPSRPSPESPAEERGAGQAGDTEELLVGVVSAMWRARFYLGAGLLLGAVLGLTVAALGTPRFAVTMVVAPPVHIQGSGGGNESSLRSTVASLTGGSIDVGGESPLYERFLLLLTSYPVVQAVEQRHQIMKRVFAGAWDEETQTWQEPGGLRRRASAALDSIVGLPEWKPPTLIDLTEELKRSVRVHIDGKGPVRKVIMESSDPAFAADLLDALYVEAMRVMREQTRQRLDAQMAMVQESLSRIQNAENRMALAQMVVSLQLDQMLIADDIPVGAVMLQPPTASSRPASPNVKMLLITLVALGGMAGFATYLVVTVYRRRSRQ